MGGLGRNDLYGSREFGGGLHHLLLAATLYERFTDRSGKLPPADRGDFALGGVTRRESHAESASGDGACASWRLSCRARNELASNGPFLVRSSEAAPYRYLLSYIGSRMFVRAAEL